MKERFDSFWVPEPNTGCWLWIGGKDPDGYGIFSVRGKATRAHRLAWKMAHKRDPGDAFVRHTCDTPECVNPEHLLVGTHQDNMHDMVVRNRSAKGERNAQLLYPERRAYGDRNGSRKHPERLKRHHGETNGQARLTEDVVQQIRTTPGTCRELAVRFGVSPSQINRIKLGQRWGHSK